MLARPKVSLRSPLSQSPTTASCRRLDAGQSGPGIIVTDLGHEADNADETIENPWARYLSPPSDKTANEAVRQPYYLVEDATDKKADEKADKSNKSQEPAGSGA